MSLNNVYQATPDDDESRMIEISAADIEEADILRVSDSLVHLLKDDKSIKAQVIEADYEQKAFRLRINGEEVRIRLRDEVEARIHEMGFDVNRNHAKLKQVISPMPGLVLKVLVNEGDVVQEGNPVLILEAMKMENVLNAPSDGTVTKVNVVSQKNVDKGQVLIELD